MAVSRKPVLKYQQLADELRAKVLTLTSGSRLPSVRSLMKRYRVSLQTVNAALKILEDENLILTRQGSGTYVSDHRPVRLIALHRTSHTSVYEDAKEDSLKQAFLSAGWHLDTRRHDVFRTEQESYLVPEAKACAHVVMQDVAHFQGQLLDHLMLQEVPVLILGRESGTLDLDYVTSNDRMILTHVLKHLRTLGHRHIALLVNEPSVYHEIKERTRAFGEILEMMDLPPGIVIDCETRPGQKSTHAAHRGLKDFLLKLGDQPLPFTSLVVSSTAGGIGALRAFFECGISIPDDCSVASQGAEEENQLTIPSITDAGTLIELWGEWVVKVLKQRLDENPSPTIGYRLPVVLTERESTCRVPRKPVRVRPRKAKASTGGSGPPGDESGPEVLQAAGGRKSRA
ncbi:MAG: substrate-binding domain-containing protein [Verrucomicrobiota bacterium]